MQDDFKLAPDTKNDFVWLLFKRYMNYCNKEEQEMTLQGFAKYMIACGVISERTVAKFMVNELYPLELHQADGGKMEAIQAVSEQVGLCESQVRYMVNNPEKYGYRGK